MGLVEAFNRDHHGNPLPDGASRSLESVVRDWVRPKLAPKETGVTAEQLRRDAMRLRLDLFSDRGRPHYEAMLRAVWQDRELLQEQLRFLPYARFQNVVKRIARLVGTVYSEPTKRRATDQDKLDAFVKETRLDEELRAANRYTIFLNDGFLTVRVQDGKPRVEFVTPDAFSVVTDPYDPRKLTAIILDKAPDGPGVTDEDPHFEGWSDTEHFWLDRNYNLVEFEPNEFKLIPGVLVNREKPRHGLLDQHSGQDIIDAQMAVVLMSCMMLNGQQIGTKVPYTSGDIAETATGQTMSQNRLTHFQEGTTPGVLDLGHDPKALIETAGTIIAQVAANYDVPEDIFRQSYNATSGFDRQLKRIGLDERRAEQIPVFRSVEHELAVVAARVMDVGEADPEFKFSAEGYEVDFGEVTTPQDPLSRLQYRKESRSMLLTNVLDDIAEDNPDLDDDGVRKRLFVNLAVRAEEVDLMRKLNMPRDPSQPGQSPQQNGAANGDAGQTGANNDDDGQDGRSGDANLQGAMEN